MEEGCRSFLHRLLTADLNFQDLQRSTELWLEQDVEQLAALRLLVVNEQTAGRTTTAEATEPPEPTQGRAKGR